MTVTTGARATRSSGFVSSDSTCSSSCSNVRIFTSAPNSRAIIIAVSVSSVLLMFSIMRFINSFASTSLTRRSSLSARSLTVIPSASVIVREIGGGPTGAAGICGRESRPGPSRRGPDGRAPPPGRPPPGRDGHDVPPGRGGMPGRATMPGAPGVCGRTGCDGRGRGPPSGADGWYGGRTSGGRAVPGRAGAGAPGRAATAGRGAGRGGAGGATGRGVTTGRAVVCGASGADDGRFSSMRRRSVGGTKRPAGGAGRCGAVGAPADAAASGSCGAAPSGAAPVGCAACVAATGTAGSVSEFGRCTDDGLRRRRVSGGGYAGRGLGRRCDRGRRFELRRRLDLLRFVRRLRRGGVVVVGIAVEPSSTGAGCTGRVMVLTRRGGPSVCTGAFGGSGLRPGIGFLPLDGTGRSANKSPLGSEMPR